MEFSPWRRAHVSNKCNTFWSKGRLVFRMGISPEHHAHQSRTLEELQGYLAIGFKHVGGLQYFK
eukprot:7231404-Pyramimonas_sp.AAC.1